MRYLLDTHVFIWWAGEPARLSSLTLSLCQDPAHTLLLSMASAWEMQIKSQLGKLHLTLPLSEIIESQQQTNRLEILPITLTHIWGLAKLPDHHKDPFDRLLISQAITEGLTLISHDPEVARYPVQIAW
jgi:PIN domain nuclease of toxin-antitoxin system